MRAHTFYIRIVLLCNAALLFYGSCYVTLMYYVNFLRGIMQYEADTSERDV